MAANMRTLKFAESSSDRSVSSRTSTADPGEHSFSKPDDMTDVIFIVEDKELHFNTAVLSICSPVFKAMFKAENVNNKIPLPGKKHEDMVAFFKQLHPVYCKLTTITDDSLQKLLPLADEYQTKSVLDACEQYIGQKMPQAKTGVLTLYLTLCERHHLKSIRAQLIKHCVDLDSTQFENTAYYKDLPQELTRNILSQRCKKLEAYVNKRVKRLVGNLEYYGIDDDPVYADCSCDTRTCKRVCCAKTMSANTEKSLLPYP